MSNPMTPERLAELDAVMAKATAGEWAQGRLLSTEQTRRFSNEQRADFSDVEKSMFYVNFSPADEGRSRKRIGSTLECPNDAHANAAAIVAMHNAYPDLRAHIDAQAATIAGLTAANEDLAALGMFASHDSRCNTKISVMADCTCGYAKARSDVVTTARAALNATGAA